MDLTKFTETLTPEIVANLKTAIEIGKWPDGKQLTSEQLETCIQAVIAYEHEHVPEQERTGYVPPKSTPCAPDSKDETLKWR